LQKSKLTKNKYNIAELSEILSISQATTKNWIKLNKITPDTYDNNKPLFSKINVDNILKEIQSKSSKMLKARRNKKYITGTFFYKNYINENSENLKNVQNLLNYIILNNIYLTETEILYILADCANKLFLSKNQNLDKFACLITDLTNNNANKNNFKKKHNEIFQYNYEYEEGEDILGLLYLSLSAISSRKARGAYFTPTKIVKKVIENIDFTTNISFDNKIIDPCCGSGNFLLQLPKSINLEQIYGKDIDLTSIKLTRINMALKYSPKKIDVLYKNFTQGNFLFDKEENKYQQIIGNPPWGYNFSKNEQNSLREKYLTAKNNNIESYDTFVEKALSCLNTKGELFFVLPEAILNVKAHKTIRQIIAKSSKILYIEYLGNIFSKVQCPSIIIKLQKTKAPTKNSNIKIKTENREFVIKSERNTSDDIFNFKMNDSEFEIYNKITTIKNKVYLKNNSIFALGLVTGNNAKYITTKKTSNSEQIIKGSNISKYKIEKAENYIKFTPEKFQQVAPIEYYKAPEKMFYKFISNKLVFAYDNNKTLSLNSCNILIPTFKDLKIKYVMAILNSSVAQFIFEKKFNSIKVLRSHIETIPIPTCSKSQQKQIIELVDKILICENPEEFNNLYQTLDLIISNRYCLTNEEYKIIKKSIC
jgi:predicted RNA methylase